MASLTGDDLDGVSEVRKSPDESVIHVFCMRADRDAYPSERACKLHYGATEPDPLRTLENGTIRRYDTSHEEIKGHELHVTPAPDTGSITYVKMVERWKRFWSELPNSEFEVT
jgi:hypothetical protein